MAQEKRQEPTFYQVFHYNDKHETGVEFAINRNIEFRSYYADKSDLAELVMLSPAELQSRRKDSVEKEKSAFQAVQAAADEWTTCAVQTMLLDRAIEYVKTPVVKHTSNEWKPQKKGIMEISNRVYKMRYIIAQEKEGNHRGQWLVTWGIAINRPTRPSTEKSYWNGDVMVVEQKKKYYNAEADAQHYIQGRFDVYAHLFTEISPPIPDKFKRCFYINGVLLPGYTVAPPERSASEVADELLNFLEDSDTAGTPPEPKIAQPQNMAPKSTAAPKGTEKNPASQPPRKAARPAAKKSAAKKKTAPVR